MQGGDLLFTFPNTPIKCAGAPQKICYIADDVRYFVRYALLKTVNEPRQLSPS